MNNYRQITVEEMKNLKYGDEVYYERSYPDKFDNFPMVKAHVSSNEGAYYNSDSDEPGWEIEVDGVIFTLDSLYLKSKNENIKYKVNFLLKTNKFTDITQIESAFDINLIDFNYKITIKKAIKDFKSDICTTKFNLSFTINDLGDELLSDVYRTIKVNDFEILKMKVEKCK